MRRTLALALAATLVGVTGCGATSQPPRLGPDVPDEGVTLHVRNNTGTDVQIFVIDDGSWRRIGFVGHRSTVDFDVAGLNDSGTPLQILARPVGGQGSARAGPLTVFPGQAVTFTIEPDFARSFATVR